ncbi:MAG TPA: SDR family oxidoreductase [Steroidobacteraceae bacterium]|nr:SDR family oxidoreductase [Steroidobacteraceae bacterium]
MVGAAIAREPPAPPGQTLATMINRRSFLSAGAALAAAGTGSCSRQEESTVQPEGVPLSAFTKSSTATEVVADLDLTGKTVLITGATSGLGLESARVLTTCGARVLATGRTLEKATAACAEIGGSAVPLELELESHASVRSCAEAVRKLDTPLDVLLCNAGIMALPELEQVRGIEKQFFVNHLSHFLLVNLLLDRVTNAPQGRVVVVSSSAYKWAPPAGIEFDNLSGERDYTPNKAYGQSKTANGLFSLELASRLAGTNATSNAINPGPVDTNLSRHYPGWQRRILGLISGFLLKPVGVGASTQCYVATSPALAQTSGYYFENCNPVIPGGQMTNKPLAAQLWQKSTELVASHLA